MRTVRRALPALAALLLAAATLSGPVAGPVAAGPRQGKAPSPNVGPDCAYDTILRGQYTLIPLKNQAMITRENCGYRFRAGQQHSHLTVRMVAGKLRFHDTGTRSWRSLEAPYCRNVPVANGVAADCTVPGSTSATNPMLIEVWPRLGNDFVDTSALSAAYQVAALVDAGNDTVRLGAGDDFVNGAFDVDVATGGAGNDWIRLGEQADRIHGGSGNDHVVGQSGRDVVDGGAGRDKIYGIDGGDRIRSDDGQEDTVSCGSGADTAQADRVDRASACESLRRS